MKSVQFKPQAFRDFINWIKIDRAIFYKIVNLIQDTARDPFEGPGKPEPLKNELQGYWSRRINKKHRLVYQVKTDKIVIIACRYHYSS